MSDGMREGEGGRGEKEEKGERRERGEKGERAERREGRGERDRQTEAAFFYNLILKVSPWYNVGDYTM